MKRDIFSLGRGVLLGIIAVGLVFGVLSEVKAAPYFQGKVITFVVPTDAGGGTDIWGRMLSRHLGKFIPGNPTIVIRNIAGAEHLIGGNYVWNSKPNGLTWVVTSASTVMTNILRPKGTEFKLEEMRPVYSSPIGIVYYCKPGMIKEPKDIMTVKGLIFGHGAPTDITSSGFLWAKELLGFPTEKVILAYGGSSTARLGFLTGESNSCGESTVGYNSALRQYAEKGEVVPIFQTGLIDAQGQVVREKAAPPVPTVKELYQQIYGKEPSGPVWEVCKLVAGTRTFGKAVVLPKQTPPELVDIVKKAAIEMTKDPKFLADSEKDSPGATHFTGEGLARAYPAGVQGPPVVIQFIKKVYAEKYGVTFQ